ncbi:MAG: hypothetical protein JWO00_25 [Candidatus Parcubacteria bacterium]|nr:hypothetical protein [Candidatus Parcubacteria bacterium]
MLGRINFVLLCYSLSERIAAKQFFYLIPVLRKQVTIWILFDKFTIFLQIINN